MGLSRLLILGLAVWAGIVLWRRYKAMSGAARAETPAKRMVQCRECGVYLPEVDAGRTGEGFTCRAHEQTRPRG